MLRGGTYRESLQVQRRVTMQAFPHEQPWIVGSDLVSGFAPSGNSWTRPWTSALCHSCYPAGVIDPAFPAAGLPEQVFIDSTPLAQVTSPAGLGVGTFYYDSAHRMLDLGSDPTGHSVEVTARPMALSLSSSAAGSAVLGIGFARTGSTYTAAADGSVVDLAAGVTFDRDTFAWSASRGLSVFAPNVVVTNNLFLYSGSNGFHGHHADGLVFQNNRVAYANEEHFSILGTPFAAEAGVKITHSWNCVISGNLFDDNSANGLWLDIASTNVAIVNNTMARNAGHGLAYEISGNALIAGNLIVNNVQDGVKLSGVSHAEVWNNTIAGNGWSQLGVYEDPRHDSNPIDNAAGITFDSTNIRVANNVFVAGTNASKPVFESFDVSPQRHLTTPQMVAFDDRNLWSRPTAVAPSILVNWQSSLSAMSRYTSLASTQSGTGREGQSIAADNAALSALFTDPANGDYSPLASGPLSQPGVALPTAVAAAMGVNASPAQLGAPNPPNLNSPGGGGGTTTTTAPATTTTTIQVTTTTIPVTTTTTPTPPQPVLTIDSVSVNAGNGHSAKLRFTITLSRASSSVITIDYSTANGSAHAGPDYTSRHGSATFDPGMLTRHVVVDVQGHGSTSAKTFYVNLSRPKGATVAHGRGTATIR